MGRRIEGVKGVSLAIRLGGEDMVVEVVEVRSEGLCDRSDVGCSLDLGDDFVERGITWGHCGECVVVGRGDGGMKERKKKTADKTGVSE